MMQALAGLLTFFIIMNDYGFKPTTLIGLLTEEGYFPHPDDVYNPDVEGYGNRNFGDD